MRAKRSENPHNGEVYVYFYCPGCKTLHNIVAGPGHWEWNGSEELPTFAPSVLVTWEANPNASEEFKEWRNSRRCHSFVRDGRIEFLTDSTHELAGQTVDLPEHDFSKYAGI